MIEKHTSLSVFSRRSKLKLGSAVHRSVGGRQTRFPSAPRGVEDCVHRGSCLLYAILIEHVDPIPVDDETDEQVAKSISKVPSRSDGPSLNVSESVQD